MNIANTYWRCEQRAVHEMRVPCLPESQAEYVEISDIRFVHLSRLNRERLQNKFDFYQVHTILDLKKRKSAIALHRQYNPPTPKTMTVKDEISLREVAKGADVKNMINLGDKGLHYIDEMIQIFEREGYNKFLKLNIWSNPYLLERGINPHRPFHVRLLHWYLNHTDNSNWLVRYFDKVLNRLFP